MRADEARGTGCEDSHEGEHILDEESA
jgi:hypothetical protein